MKLRLWCVIALLTLLLVPPLAQAKGTAAAPPAPTLVGNVNGDLSIMGSTGSCGTPGTWYVGATPPNVDYSKPVLLFVHGKGSCAQTWWGETTYHGTNDMYTYAYNNGYRTAFVDLYGDKDMWVNGSLLNSMIDTIRSYFGVSRLSIVAHSKGGVDSNAALVHYGAAGKITRVVTLGSPHWGTPIADYAYSTWTWWLAEILGERNDATYVMQTGYMNYFRSITDGRDATPFYTLSGYKCGPVFSAMWYSCAFISGEDDGVVPVWSARIPGGTHLKEGYWDHDEIKMGSRTWGYFAPVIQTAYVPTAVAVERLLAAANGSPAAGRTAAAQPASLILRGGDTSATAAPQTFPVESGVASVTFSIYASSADLTATLTGPDGKEYAVVMEGQGDELYADAWVGHVTVDAPPAGSWSLSASAPGRAGYLMIAALDSDLTVTLDTGNGVGAPGAARALTVAFTGARRPAGSQAEGVVALSTERRGAPFVFGEAQTGAAGAHRASVAVPARSGIYSASVTVKGTLADGTAFERDLAGSFAAVAPGERGTWR